MDIEPVQIAAVGQVGKAHNDAVPLRHQSGVGLKGGIPGRQIHLAIGPGIQLLRGIIPPAHPMDRLIEELRQNGAVRRAVGPYRQTHVRCPRCLALSHSRAPY